MPNQGTVVPIPTVAELLAEVHAAVVQPPDDPGITAGDYGDEHGMTRAKARGILDRAVDAGKLLRGTAYLKRTKNDLPYRQVVYRPNPDYRPR